jgi:hypothetical protein
MANRTFTYITTGTLKNGETREYVCTGRYTTKTTRRANMGKEIARKRIAKCNDKEKIDMLYKYMCEIGM